MRRQINEYNPGIVISAGPQLEYLYSEDTRGPKLCESFQSSHVDRYEFDGRIWLQTYHPEYLRINRFDWVFAIAQALRIPMASASVAAAKGLATTNSCSGANSFLANGVTRN